MDSRRLMINCDVCDARHIDEASYASCDEIVVNADVLILSDRTKAALYRLPIAVNCDSTLIVDEDAPIAFQTLNGACHLNAACAPDAPTILTVNGDLTVDADARAALSRFLRITVNGDLWVPRSLSGLTAGLTVNGNTCVYPDGAKALRPSFTIDAVFPRRAAEGALYFAQDEVIVQCNASDLAMLVDKRVRIETPRVVLPEACLDACAQIFDEAAEFVVVPAGMTLICRDATLDAALVGLCGGQIFVDGNLTVDESFDFAGVERLIVTGKATLRREQAEAFGALNAICGAVEVQERRVIQNQLQLQIDAALIAAEPGGVLLKNIAEVTLDARISPDAIAERLAFVNCALVRCAPEQRSAVIRAARNVLQVSCEADEDAPKPTARDDSSARMINADVFRL